nr:hypothetical protein [Tanacetum cinerariifolium]
RDSSSVVLAFTSFFLFCMSSAVNIKASYQALIPLDVPKNRIYYLIKSSAIFTTVASLFFSQWELSSLAVGTSPSSGNFITGSGNTLCILFPTKYLTLWIFDCRCSRHMTGNKYYLIDYQKINGGFVAFGENAKGGEITGNGTKANIDAGQAGKKTVPDPGRERAPRNVFESMFGQDKNANGNRMFTPVSAAGSTYVNLGGSIPVNAATLPNADLLTDPIMFDLEDTADL